MTTNFLEVTSFDPLLISNTNKGDKGDPGTPGATPNLQIGTVTTLPTGSPATASLSGTAANPLLNLGLPAGQQGPTGASGSASLSAVDNGNGTATISWS